MIVRAKYAKYDTLSSPYVVVRGAKYETLSSPYVVVQGAKYDTLSSPNVVRGQIYTIKSICGSSRPNMIHYQVHMW